MYWIIAGLVLFWVLCTCGQWMVGTAFAGMMEPSKSRRLMSYGIAAALLGPLSVGALILLAGLINSLGWEWAGRSLMIAAVVIFCGWVIVGIVLWYAKQKHAGENHEPLGDSTES